MIMLHRRLQLVSALGYSHKLSGFPDPSRAFFIMQMLKGYTKLGARQSATNYSSNFTQNH